MSFDPTRRPPIVTDADRQWAIDQKPDDWDETTRGLAWEDFVSEQAERFEAHFGYDRKPAAEWSGLWRRVSWPTADPRKLHPATAPPGPSPILVRAGEPSWPMALARLTPPERALAERLGVVPFRRDDPRAEGL